MKIITASGTSLQLPEKRNKDIEKLFIDFAKIIDCSLKKGISYVELELFEEEKEDFAYKILNLAINLIKCGVEYDFCKFKIELETEKVFRNNQMNDELLERIFLVKKFTQILYKDNHDPESLLAFAQYFCCPETRSEMYFILEKHLKDNF